MKVFRTLIAAAAALGLSVAAEAGERTVFAWMSDLHVAVGSPSVTALSSCVRDLNSLAGTPDAPQFVLVSGDMTNFGSDEEISLVKALLDSLTVPYYAIPGNHDAKWSESGCNTFGKVFDGEDFLFEAGGYRFVGCASGPDMRMTPALIPRQHMKWLSELAEGESKPTIFVNHFPQDSSVLNYGDVWRLMRKLDTRVALGGHWHRNVILDYDGIPGVLCRSTLATSSTPTGYGLAVIEDDVLSVRERRYSDGGFVSGDVWFEKDLSSVAEASMGYDADGLPDSYPWLRYDVNGKYPSVRESWRITEDANIASGFACDGAKRAWYVTETGSLKCIRVADGKTLWATQLPGKVFSTPVYAKSFCRGLVVLGCADGGLYAFRARSGRIKWVAPTSKSVLASPTVVGRKVLFGASDGVFRAVHLKSGRPVWEYDGVEGFVECRAYADDQQVVFGDWKRTLYSLSTETGELQWKWEVPKRSDMYSPAACWPVKAAGKIFVAVPDRKVYALDAATGQQVSVADGGREAIGLSEDGRTVYAKTMFSRAYALDSDTCEKIWDVRVPGLGYEIAPTSLLENDGVVIIPTDKGNIFGLSSEDGSVVWIHKISPALVNPLEIVSVGKGTGILASTLDGVVALLELR